MNRSLARPDLGGALPAIAVVVIGSLVVAQQDFGSSWAWVLVAVAGIVGLATSWLVLARLAPQPSAVAAPASEASPPASDLAVLPRPQQSVWSFAPDRPDPTATDLTETDPTVPRRRRLTPVAQPAVLISTPKLGASPAENEDAGGFEPGRSRYVMSDGAGSSFGAREWAQSLVRSVLDAVDPLSSAAAFDAAVADAAARWASGQQQTADAGWWARAGLERGSFATLLVVEIGRDDDGLAWSAVAIGDSCLMQVRRGPDGWRIVRSFPLASAEEFDSNPALCSSASPGVAQVALAGRARLRPGDVLLLATDAVSQWLLSGSERAAELIDASPDGVVELLDAAKRSKAMVNDDATVLRVDVAGIEGAPTVLR